MTPTGNNAETCCLFFRFRNDSKKVFEVLRLGSGERREPDPRTSIRAIVRIRINLRIGALPLEWQQRCFRGRDGDNARHPKLAAWRRLGWRGLDGSELADAGILEDRVEAF